YPARAERRDVLGIRHELRFDATASDRRARLVVQPSIDDLFALVNDRQACTRRPRQDEAADDLLECWEQIALAGRRVNHEHAILAVGRDDPNLPCLPRDHDRAVRWLKAMLVLDRHAVSLSPRDRDVAARKDRVLIGTDVHSLCVLVESFTIRVPPQLQIEGDAELGREHVGSFRSEPANSRGVVTGDVDLSEPRRPWQDPRLDLPRARDDQCVAALRAGDHLCSVSKIRRGQLLNLCWCDLPYANAVCLTSLRRGGARCDARSTARRRRRLGPMLAEERSDSESDDQQTRRADDL